MKTYRLLKKILQREFFLTIKLIILIINSMKILVIKRKSNYNYINWNIPNKKNKGNENDSNIENISIKKMQEE